MKRTILGLATILVVLLTVLAVLVVHPTRRVKASVGCTASTLSGPYGWSEFGLEPEDARPLHWPPIPPSFWTESALVDFTPTSATAGTFTGSDVSYIENGKPQTSGFTGGNYTVESDCSVTMTYTWDSVTYTDHGIIVGNEVIATEQDSSNDTTGHVVLKQVVPPV